MGDISVGRLLINLIYKAFMDNGTHLSIRAPHYDAQNTLPAEGVKPLARACIAET